MIWANSEYSTGAWVHLTETHWQKSHIAYGCRWALTSKIFSVHISNSCRINLKPTIHNSLLCLAIEFQGNYFFHGFSPSFFGVSIQGKWDEMKLSIAWSASSLITIKLKVIKLMKSERNPAIRKQQKYCDE